MSQNCTSMLLHKKGDSMRSKHSGKKALSTLLILALTIALNPLSGAYALQDESPRFVSHSSAREPLHAMAEQSTAGDSTAAPKYAQNGIFGTLATFAQEEGGEEGGNGGVGEGSAGPASSANAEVFSTRPLSTFSQNAPSAQTATQFLSEVFAGAAEGDTVVLDPSLLLDSFDEPSNTLALTSDKLLSVTGGKSITLDMNGHNLAYTTATGSNNMINVAAGSSLRVIDSTNAGSTIKVEKSSTIALMEGATLAIEGVNVTGDNTTGVAPLTVKGDNARLDLSNMTVTQMRTGSQEGFGNVAQGIQVAENGALGGSPSGVTLNLTNAHVKLPANYSRGICFIGGSDAAINMTSSSIIAGSTPDTVNGTYSRGIATYQDEDNLRMSITLIDSEIKGMYYPLNLSGETAFAPNGSTDVVVRNSVLQGYGVINSYQAGCTFDIAQSLLIGNNPFLNLSGWNNFSLIVLNRNEGVINNRFDFTDTTLRAIMTNTAWEDMIDDRDFADALNEGTASSSTNKFTFYGNNKWEYQKSNNAVQPDYPSGIDLTIAEGAQLAITGIGGNGTGNILGGASQTVPVLGSLEGATNVYTAQGTNVIGPVSGQTLTWSSNADGQGTAGWVLPETLILQVKPSPLVAFYGGTSRTGSSFPVMPLTASGLVGADTLDTIVEGASVPLHEYLASLYSYYKQDAQGNPAAEPSLYDEPNAAYTVSAHRSPIASVTLQSGRTYVLEMSATSTLTVLPSIYQQTTPALPVGDPAPQTVLIPLVQPRWGTTFTNSANQPVSASSIALVTSFLLSPIAPADKATALLDKLDQLAGPSRSYAAVRMSLADLNNGNAYVKQNGTMTVYLPYLTGTSRSNSFEVVHFVENENDPQNPYSYDVDNPEIIKNENIVKTNEYLSFDVTSFSPFAVIYDMAPTLYEIEASAGTHGSVSPVGKQKIREETDAVFTFEPDPGYEIAEVLVDGVPDPQAMLDERYTFTTVSLAHTLRVVFARTAGYTVSYQPNGGVGSVESGTAYYNGDFTLSEGAGLSREGYTLAGWARSAQATTPEYALGYAFAPWQEEDDLELHAVLVPKGTPPDPPVPPTPPAPPAPLSDDPGNSLRLAATGDGLFLLVGSIALAAVLAGSVLVLARVRRA